MCGFAGIINFKGLSEKNIRPSLLRAGERLKPRGPDSSNIWLDNKCALVNTRLAIQDLSETANLPMAKGNLVIAYNGEIYNFKLLKKELQSLGHKFTTNGDTEVVLEGWKAWGIQLLDKLSGMFAFVIWNSSTGKAFFDETNIPEQEYDLMDLNLQLNAMECKQRDVISFTVVVSETQQGNEFERRGVSTIIHII